MSATPDHSCFAVAREAATLRELLDRAVARNRLRADLTAAGFWNREMIRAAWIATSDASRFNRSESFDSATRAGIVFA